MLAEPTRRRIVGELRVEARDVSNLMEILGVSQSLMSKHLKVLRDASVVTVEVLGKRRVYRLSDDPLPDAELVEQDSGWTLTMRRVLTHRPEQVWPMLTDPRQLARWSPIVPNCPLTSVGPAASRETPETAPVDTEVLECQAPSLLVHRWGPSTLLRWTLRPVPDGTRLTLAQTFTEPGQAPIYSAGWHICVAVLTATDDGLDVPRVVGQDALQHGWEQLRDDYSATLTRT